MMVLKVDRTDDEEVFLRLSSSPGHHREQFVDRCCDVLLPTCPVLLVLGVEDTP
jgi:hypothetical protein